MNRNPEEGIPNVEQSWIVLDDHGWASSRPGTASPSRPVPRMPLFEEEEEDDDDSSITRRLGMDRDVREALELAERSLELAGSAEEFVSSHYRNESSEDDQQIGLASQISSKSAMQFTEDSVENRYNGRGPPMVKRTLTIATDSEHKAFQNIKVVGGSVAFDEQPARSSPLQASETTSRADTPMPFVEQTWIPSKAYHHNDKPSSPYYASENNEDDEGFLQWMFGLQPNASVLPLVLTHAITLAAGLYIGMKRVSLSPVSVCPSQSANNLAGVSQQT